MILEAAKVVYRPGYSTVKDSVIKTIDGVFWKDIQFPISAGKVPATNTPTYSAFTASTNQYLFSVNDYMDLQAEEMPHWWKEGSGVYPHCHIALFGVNDTEASMYAKFSIYLAYAKVGAAFVQVSRTMEIEIPPGTVNRTHFMGQGDVIDFSGLTIGTQVIPRVYRHPATLGTEFIDDIFITQVGLHAEVDGLGSKEIGAK